MHQNTYLIIVQTTEKLYTVVYISLDYIIHIPGGGEKRYCVLIFTGIIAYCD